MKTIRNPEEDRKMFWLIVILGSIIVGMIISLALINNCIIDGGVLACELDLRTMTPTDCRRVG